MGGRERPAARRAVKTKQALIEGAIVWYPIRIQSQSTAMRVICFSIGSFNIRMRKLLFLVHPEKTIIQYVSVCGVVS